MLKRWTQQARAFIASLTQKSRAYLQNERTRQVSNQENAETGIVIFLLVVVFAIAGLK